MSLLSIRAEVASKLGFNVSNEDERLWINDLINKAAKEIWDTNNLVNTNKELVLYFDGTTKQVALPYFIQQGLAYRYYNSQYKIPVNGMEPRYQVQGFGQYLLNWREKGKSPLAVQISNQSILKFTLSQRETVAITLNIVGRTPNSYRIQEKVIIPIGSLTAISINDYIEIYSIEKSDVNVYNITVSDVDDNIEGNVATSGVEVLYKNIFHIMQNDYDQFQAEGYDQAIFWKCMELWHGKQDDANAAGRALAAQTKCNQLLSDISKDALDGREMEIQFGPNKFYGLQRPSSFLGTSFRN